MSLLVLPKKRVTEVNIVSQSSVYQFEKSLNYYLAEGWRFHGETYQFNGELVQMLVRETEIEQKL